MDDTDQYEDRDPITTTLRRDEDPGMYTIEEAGERGPGPERVQAAFFYAAGLLATKPANLVGRIADMLDHQGFLTVTWRSRPTPAEEWAIEKAWADAGDEYNIEHEIIK